eukprot:10990330-Karenia_brevis.AAC.1
MPDGWLLDGPPYLCRAVAGELGVHGRDLVEGLLQVGEDLAHQIFVALGVHDASPALLEHERHIDRVLVRLFQLALLELLAEEIFDFVDGAWEFGIHAAREPVRVFDDALCAVQLLDFC